MSREDLLARGMTPRAIEYRLWTGELIAIRPGTYLFTGGPETRRQQLIAVREWAGDGSAFSHRCAAEQWGMDGVPEGITEITTPRRLNAPGVVVHRCKLEPRDIRNYRSLPLTVPERTLMDLGAVVGPLQVEIATDSAFRLGLTTLPRAADYIAAHGGPGRRGSRVARKILADRLLDAGRPHSVLETLLRRVILDSTLPRPALQYRIEEAGEFIARVDAAYPRVNLAIEGDGWEFHMGRVVWKNDLRRRNRLLAAGWHVLHFTYEDVTKRPGYVVETIETVLCQLGYYSLAL